MTTEGRAAGNSGDDSVSSAPGSGEPDKQRRLDRPAALASPVTRKPMRFANYRGDQTQMVGQVVGPNLLGEHLQCVTADYDPANNRTRAGFAFGIQPKK